MQHVQHRLEARLVQQQEASEHQLQQLMAVFQETQATNDANYKQMTVTMANVISDDASREDHVGTQARGGTPFPPGDGTPYPAHTRPRTRQAGGGHFVELREEASDSAGSATFIEDGAEAGEADQVDDSGAAIAGQVTGQAPPESVTRTGSGPHAACSASAGGAPGPAAGGQRAPATAAAGGVPRLTGHQRRELQADDRRHGERHH